MMQRFITYLYTYENGQKKQNCGYVRTDCWENSYGMDISVRLAYQGMPCAKAYLLFAEKENALSAISLCSVEFTGQQGKGRVEFSGEQLEAYGKSFQEIVGIALVLEGEAYLAGAWIDEVSEDFCRGRFKVLLQQENPKEVGQALAAAELDDDQATAISQLLEEARVQKEEDRVPQEKNSDPKEEVDGLSDLWELKKMNLSQFQSLPRKYWYLCNNSFLIHGFFNYHHLALFESKDEKKRQCLGVPGVFERPEKVMAMMFGFPEFVLWDEERQQLIPYEGDEKLFGYWAFYLE